MGLNLQLRKMSESIDSTITNRGSGNGNINKIPKIVVSGPTDLDENIITKSVFKSKDEENDPRNSNSMLATPAPIDKEGLKKDKLRRTNILKRGSEGKLLTPTWQKGFVKKQTVNLINKDKFRRKISESIPQSEEVPRNTTVKSEIKNDPYDSDKSLKLTKTWKMESEGRVRRTGIDNKHTASFKTEMIPNDLQTSSKKEKGNKNFTTFKNKKAIPSTNTMARDLRKGDKNGEEIESRMKNKDVESITDDNDRDNKSISETNNVLKNPKGKEIKNIPQKDNLNVTTSDENTKNHSSATTNSNEGKITENIHKRVKISVENFSSFKKRKKYGNDLRNRIGKKWNIDTCNRRLLYSDVYGRRKESVNKVQTLVKEEKGKRQVSFSDSGLPIRFSTYTDKDNSFARFNDISSLSSLLSAKDKSRKAAIVKPMPSRKQPVSYSVDSTNSRIYVPRSPTFTKEAPEVLQNYQETPRTQHVRRTQPDHQDISRRTQQKVETKLKYKPHIHRRDSTNEAAHLYTEVHVPVKREYQKHFDSFVLLDKNFDDSEDLKENFSENKVVSKNQSRFSSQISSNRSLRPKENSNSPVIEIVFQPNMGQIVVTEQEQHTLSTTRVYMKSGTVSAFLHRGTSATSPENFPDVPEAEVPKVHMQRSKSEIPVYSDDEYEVYPVQRPHTDTYREYPPFVMGRYEQAKMNSDFNEKIEVHRTTDRKGKRVTFFRNGDKDFKGVNVCINPKQFLNFEALLVYLNDRIETTSGVRYVFSLPDGKEIKSVTSFQQGRSYIVSSVKKPALDIPYGQSREQFWNNRKPSASRVRKSEVELFKRSESPKNAPKNKPRVITVINNEYRDKREKFYINPNTRHNFEDLLLTMGDMTNIDIHALYTEKQPHKKVESFSQLFNEFKNQDNFIACGPELEPLKPENVKRPAPSSNSGSDSMSVASRMKKFHKANDGELDEIDEYGMQHSPSPQEGILNGVPVNGYQEPISARHFEEDDSVKFTIRGRVREYFPPSITYPDDDGQRPDKKLKLEWIYGFHAREGCKSVVVYRTGELLYYVAAVAVFFRRNEDRGDTQRHYLGHTEDISCLELHPSENLIASGQIAGKENPAHVRIWDGEKLTTHHVIGISFFTNGIASIGFSEQSRGGFMCVSDSSDKHVLSIWDWEKEKMIAKTTTTTKSVNCCCFYKYDDTLLITYGADHLFFWRLFWDPVGIQDGKLYRDKLSGVFEEGTQPSMVTSHAFSSSGDVITGDSNGSIMVWTKDSEFVFRVNMDVSAGMKGAHLKPVNALCMMGDNTLLSGGGTFIKSWDSINNYRKISKREIPEIAGNVRTIIPQRGSGADGQIFVGTSKSCILAGSLPVKFRFIVQGHCKDIWAIAAVPGEPAFITTAHDQFVFKWSAVRHRVIWRSQMEKPSSALAVDSRGMFVAVGSVAGRFFVLNAKNGMHIITVQVGKSQINTMRFSPDNAMLAVGCEDGHIHIFYVHDDGQLYRKNNIILRGHSKFVTNLDWSTDSRYLQSVDGDFELLCWNIQRMEREAPRALRDCNWQTYSCCAGHPLMGPWTSCDPGENVSVVARSNYREVIVTGDNTGRIKVFKYPSSTNMPACRWTKLYSTTVTALEFLYDDSFMVSAAGKMPVLAQWSVVDTFSGKQYNI